MSIVERERVETEVVTTRDVLHRAADLLEEFGWGQGQECQSGNLMAGGAYGFCVGGAVRRARSELLGIGREEDVYVWAGFHGLRDVVNPNWNDVPGRTKAEVVTRLRDAANAL